MQPSDIMFQTKLLRYIHVPLYPACISQHKGPLDAKTMKLQWTQTADDVVLCTPIFCTQNTHFPGQHFLTHTHDYDPSFQAHQKVCSTNKLINTPPMAVSCTKLFALIASCNPCSLKTFS